MSLKTRLAGASLAASMSIAATVVMHFEGSEHEAYIDPVGVVTICYGHTATAELGQVRTEDECQELLKQDLGIAFDAVEKHVQVPLTVERRAALASFVFNFGETKFRTSTMLRKLNAGDASGACAEMRRWVKGKVQGEWHVFKGLVDRRAVERELCEVGL